MIKKIVLRKSKKQELPSFKIGKKLEESDIELLIESRLEQKKKKSGGRTRGKDTKDSASSSKRNCGKAGKGSSRQRALIRPRPLQSV